MRGSLLLRGKGEIGVDVAGSGTVGYGAMDRLRSILRSRWVQLAFFAALIFFAADTCDSETAEVRFHFDLGEERVNVRNMRVELFTPGEEVADGYYQVFGGEKSLNMRPWKAEIPSGKYELRFLVELRDGTERRFRRTVTVEGSGKLTVPLASDLASGK